MSGIAEGKLVIVKAVTGIYVGKVNALSMYPSNDSVKLTKALEIVTQQRGGQIGIGLSSPVIPINQEPAEEIIITAPFVVIPATKEIENMYVSTLSGIQIVSEMPEPSKMDS